MGASAREAASPPPVAEKAPVVDKASPGRIVFFGFKEGESIVERPAMVVRVDGDAVDLQVFTADCDRALRHGGETPSVVARAGVLASSDMSAAQADRWRWPPRGAV